jgi:hypothetical protein
VPTRHGFWPALPSRHFWTESVLGRSAVSDPDLTVLIDCDESGRDGWGSVPHGGRVMRWQLAERRFDDAMCREIRTRVEQLAASLPARMDDGD